MAVNPDGVVEGLDVLKDQGISPVKGLNTEAVQPFPLDQGMEGFDAGVIVGITLVAVAQLELFGGIPVSLGNVLCTAIAMQDQRLIGLPPGLGQIDCFHYILGFQGWGKYPGNDLPGVKIHDAGQVGKAFVGVDVGDVGTPYGVGTVRIELLIQDVVQFLTEVGVNGGGNPGLDPLGPDPHLPHVLADSAFGDPFSFLLKLPGDLWGSVVLVGVVVDLLNPFLDPFLTQLSFREPVLEESPVAGT